MEKLCASLVAAALLWRLRVKNFERTSLGKRERKPSEAFAADLVAHETVLPAKFVDMVPEREVRIIRFLLDCIHWKEHPIDGLFVNGGYVRDMLLERVPDDLDISLCLVDCTEDVTVMSILQDMHAYKEFLGEQNLLEQYGFTGLKSVEIQGDISKSKQLDTAKAVFSFEPGTPTVELDLMPTIGEESYDEDHHRIPTRDQRGTPKQDALRRDLTIGSMLVHVRLISGSDFDGNLTPCTSARCLSWTLLDYFGGLSDLQQGLLRAPKPDTLPDLCTIFTTEEDLQLAKAVGLDMSDAQLLWWIKILRDDPVRVLRVFRFAAKLDFSIDPSFWVVIPFAMEKLKSRVAGSRKMTEILKLAKYGRKKLIDLFGLSFRKRFVYRPDGAKTCLAPAIFGGQDGLGKVHFLPFVESFNKDWFMALVSESAPPSLSCDEAVGLFLAISVFCSSFPPYAEWSSEDPSNVEDGHLPMEKIFERSCNGLCTSNELRSAGLIVIRSYQGLITLNQEKSNTPKLDSIFGHHLTPELLGDETEPGVVFFKYRKVWEEFKLFSALEHFSHSVILNMLSLGLDEKSQGTFDFIKGALVHFQSAKDLTISGRSIAGMKEIVPQLRTSLILRLNVLTRLIGYRSDLIEHSELQRFLTETCPALLDELLDEWYEDRATLVLREQYGKKKQSSTTKTKKGPKQIKTSC